MHLLHLTDGFLYGIYNANDTMLDSSDIHLDIIKKL